jgi:hypothetical protein
MNRYDKGRSFGIFEVDTTSQASFRYSLYGNNHVVWDKFFTAVGTGIETQ